MNKKQLTIIVDRTSVHIAEVLRSTQNITHQSHHPLTAHLSKDIIKELNDIFDKTTWIQEYDEYTLAWGTNSATLIPSPVFEASDAKKISHLMLGENIPNDAIDYNRLPELNVVNVYEIPMWVKSFFVRKFPKLLIQHENTMLLRAVFQNKIETTTAFISCFEAYFTLIIIDSNQLIFSNHFEFQNSKDILYYLMFVLNQKMLMDKKVNLKGFVCDINSDVTLKEAFTTIEQKKLLPSFSIDQQISSLFKNQLLCV